MAKFQFEGMQEYLEKLNKIGTNADGSIKRAVYSGASVVLKQVENAIQNLPTKEHKYVYSGQINAISPEQKQGLLDGLGASKMQNDNGYINTKIGFDGYNSVKSKKYPNGQPNSLIARAIESGTSMRPKTRFVANATKAAKGPAEKAMAEQFDKDIKQIMEG